jgi:hypothetical protein
VGHPVVFKHTSVNEAVGQYNNKNRCLSTFMDHLEEFLAHALENASQIQGGATKKYPEIGRAHV